MIGYMRSAVHRGRKACGSILRPAPRGHTPPTRAGESPLGGRPRGSRPPVRSRRVRVPASGAKICRPRCPSPRDAETRTARDGGSSAVCCSRRAVGQRATSLLSALAACALLGEAIDGWRQERAEFRVSAETLPPPTTLMGPRLLYTRSVFFVAGPHSRLTLLIFDFFAKPPGHDGYAFVI